MRGFTKPSRFQFLNVFKNPYELIKADVDGPGINENHMAAGRGFTKTYAGILYAGRFANGVAQLARYFIIIHIIWERAFIQKYMNLIVDAAVADGL